MDKVDTLVNIKKKLKQIDNEIKEVFIMKIKATITNLKNDKVTECYAQVTGVGRVISLSLSDDEFCQTPDEYRALTKILKKCIEGDLQDNDKFLLNHPDKFAMERQYLWCPMYYGNHYMFGEVQTVCLHGLFGAEPDGCMEKIMQILLG